MAIGPVQLFVLGFDRPDFHGQIIDELERLKASGTINVIDALAVHKDANGDIEVAHLSNLTMDEAIEIGSVVGALVGLGIDGEEGMLMGAVLGAEAGAEGLEVFEDREVCLVLRVEAAAVWEGLGLEAGEEGLAGGVVVAVAPGAHALGESQ